MLQSPLMRRILLLLLLTTFLPAQSAPEVEVTAEPHHHQVFANSQVRVFNVEVPAHANTVMHWHRHDYVYVMLGAAHVSNEIKGKAALDVKLVDGETNLLSAPYAHFVRNLSDQPFRSVIVELLQDDKLRHSSHPGSAHADEDRGLEILHGGTEEILLVKDGVRLSEVDLQPGGMVPMNNARPHLLVALSALKLRNHVKGKAPSDVELKSGETLWLKPADSHMLTNAAAQPAKWITLEFQ